ncbi:MAG: hypothetical protein RIR55_1483 [Bacteroidota bacterium]|jgi:hypothetical protein
MKFYRYQPINKYTLTNLVKSKNWVADPMDFNDPFEFRMTDISYLDSKGELSYLDESGMKARCHYEQNINKIGVISYSSIENNTLMFSHYADQHKGFCLEFDVPKENLIGMKKIRYQDNFKTINYPLDRDLLKRELITICTTKSKVWEYEQEYRQLFTDKHFHAEYPGQLTGIIFGCKTSKDDIELVLSVIKQLDGLEISKAFIQKNTFNLGLCTVPFLDDGTFKVPQFWDGLYEA